MRIIVDRLQPELACNFFLACPFAAQKQIVAQPRFPELAGPETVDKKLLFSRQLALLVATAQNHNEEVPTEMVTGEAYPAWVMESGFKEAYDEFCHHQNILNVHREGQESTDPVYSEEESSEEESSSSQGGNAPWNRVRAKLPIHQELKLAIESAYDPYRKLSRDDELKEAKAAFDMLSPGSPVNVKTFFFVGVAMGYIFKDAKLLCKLFAVPHPACLQFLFAAMDSADDKVQEKIKDTLKEKKPGRLLLNTVTNMAWDQKEAFKSVGSLDIAKKILELIDRKNKKEMGRFGDAIAKMHFSETEI
jgi:hypothetical protein